MLVLLNKMQNERILDENSFVDDLNPEILQKQSDFDPFDVDIHDPNFDKYTMNKMLRLQKKIQGGNAEKFKKITKKYYLN